MIYVQTQACPLTIIAIQCSIGRSWSTALTSWKWQYDCVSVLSPYWLLTTSKGSMLSVDPTTYNNRCINLWCGWKTLNALKRHPVCQKLLQVDFQPHNQPTCRQWTPPSNHTKIQATDHSRPQRHGHNFSKASTCPEQAQSPQSPPTKAPPREWPPGAHICSPIQTLYTTL